MHAQGLEIVHVCGTPPFATTVLALLPAQLLALVDAILQAPAPSFGASTFAGTGPGKGAGAIAATQSSTVHAQMMCINHEAQVTYE